MSDVLLVGEIVLCSLEALITIGLATSYVDTPRRIRREVAQKRHSGLQQRLVLAFHELDTIGEGLQARDDSAAAAAVDRVTESPDQVREAGVCAVAHAPYPLAADVELLQALLLLANQLHASARLDVRH